MHLSDIPLKGNLEMRILAEGLGGGDTDSARLPDGRPAAFQYKVKYCIQTNIYTQLNKYN